MVQLPSRFYRSHQVEPIKRVGSEFTKSSPNNPWRCSNCAIMSVKLTLYLGKFNRSAVCTSFSKYRVGDSFPETVRRTPIDTFPVLVTPQVHPRSSSLTAFSSSTFFTILLDEPSSKKAKLATSFDPLMRYDEEDYRGSFDALIHHQFNSSGFSAWCGRVWCMILQP